jgi:hypothetical protein
MKTSLEPFGEPLPRFGLSVSKKNEILSVSLPPASRRSLRKKRSLVSLPMSGDTDSARIWARNPNLMLLSSSEICHAAWAAEGIPRNPARDAAAATAKKR